MTDKEILKALECCSTGETYADCEKNGCPLYLGITMGCKYIDKENQLYSDALDLINRQKAEIEKLKGSTIVSNIMESQRIKREAKAEAYKEFATKIYQAFAVENTRDGYLDCTPNYTRLIECVDDVLKELAGDNK